jgi:hypothetical protein
MGLHGQFAQCGIGQFQRLTLRTKGSVPQAGSARFISWLVAQSAASSIRATTVTCIALGATWIAFGLASRSWDRTDVVFGLVVAETVCLAATTVSFFSIFMRVASPAIAATQFTASMAIMNLATSTGSWLAGPIGDVVDTPRAAGDLHESVQRAGCSEPVGERLHVGLDGQVGRVRHGAGVGLESGEPLGATRDSDHLPPVGAEAPCGRLADPRARTRHHCSSVRHALTLGPRGEPGVTRPPRAVVTPRFSDVVARAAPL